MARPPQLAAVVVALVLVLAAGGYGVTRGLMSDEPRLVPIGIPTDGDGHNDAPVVAAATDIPAGTKIAAGMVWVVYVSKEYATSDDFDDTAKVVGQYASRDIAAYEHVTVRDVVGSGRPHTRQERLAARSPT